MTHLAAVLERWELAPKDRREVFSVSLMPREVTRFDTLWISEPARIEELAVGNVIHYHHILFRVVTRLGLGLPTVEPGVQVRLQFGPLNAWEGDVIRVELAGVKLADVHHEAAIELPPCEATDGLRWQLSSNGFWLLIDTEYEGDWSDQVGHLIPRTLRSEPWEARQSLLHGSEHLAFGTREECAEKLMRYCVAEKRDRRQRR